LASVPHPTGQGNGRKVTLIRGSEAKDVQFATPARSE
jgi:hypothetical protein